MRVISGKYKGSKIEGFDIDGTRPTMDRVKESMFAMIQNRIKGSTVLDLFAGSGNLGIEAISNGAAKTYFVDKNEIATTTIEKNIKKMGIKEDYQVFRLDYLDALKQFSNRNIKFDLVLLDPPYRLNFINEVLDLLISFELLNEGAIVVCEYDKEEVENSSLNCIKEKKYGNKYVRIYKI